MPSRLDVSDIDPQELAGTLSPVAQSRSSRPSLGHREDNGKFWISAYGELLMLSTPTIPGNAVVLTGGNIQVPQPQGGK